MVRSLEEARAGPRGRASTRMDMEYVSNGAKSLLVDLWEDRPTNVVRSIVGWDEPNETPMRIGIVGTFGTDKNILARSIADTLEIPLIERLPRTVKNLGFSINKQADIISIVTMWMAQMAEQAELIEFITDNTILTYIAYANYIAQQERDPQITALVTALTNLTMTAFNEQYSIVLYVAPGPEIRANGVRSRDKKFQSEIDSLILKFLTNFDVDYFPVMGSPVEKFDLTMMFLDDAGFLPRET